MSEDKQAIYEALCDVMADIEAVTKSKTNQQQNYKYRSIDDVYNMIQPIFGKHKVFILPKVVEIKEEERQSKSGGILYYTTLTMEYSFYASDGSSITTMAVGKAMDSGDKSLDKAKSSAMKYLLLQMFVIPTEEDKDIEKDNPEPKGKPKEKPKEKPIENIQISVDKPTEKQTGDSVLNEMLAIMQKNHLQNWLAKNKSAIDFKIISEAYNKHLKLVTQAESLAKILVVKQEDMVEFMKAVNGGLEQSLISECIAGKQESIDEMAERFTNYLATKAMGQEELKLDGLGNGEKEHNMPA